MIKLIIITKVTKKNFKQVTEKIERELPCIRWSDGGEKPSKYFPKELSGDGDKTSLFIEVTTSSISSGCGYKQRKRDIVFEAEQYLNTVKDLAKIPLSCLITNLSPRWF